MCKIDAQEGTESLVTIGAAVLEIYRKVWRGQTIFPPRARVITSVHIHYPQAHICSDSSSGQELFVTRTAKGWVGV